MWPQRPTPLVLAHRGHHETERENTIAAFEAALAAGADGVEFDVRSTLDGELVVHHDARVRTGRRRRSLLEFGRGELPEWLPTLADTMAWAGKHPTALLDLEVKEPGIEREAARLVKRARLEERTIVTSFHPEVCFHVAEDFPSLPTGFLTEEDSPAAVGVAKEARARALIVHRASVRPSVVRLARSRGLEAWAWGANRLRDARDLVALGVRGLITDRPDRLRAEPWPASARDARRRKAPGTGRRGN